MCRNVLSLLVAGLLVGSAWAQPREWADDFTSVATYNDTSLLAPCYGPPGTPSTKYTVVEPIVGDIFNERALSGGGEFSFTNRDSTMKDWGRIEFAFVGVMNMGQGCPDTAGIPFMSSSEAFSSDDVCMYGGVTFSPWQTKDAGPNGWDVVGPDGKPGVANVDDDLDGVTDEDNEALAARPTAVGGGYGNRDGTGFQAGIDAAPGILGVDDDGNGITDDVGETGIAGDDGDDTQRQIWWAAMNADPSDSSLVFLCMDNASTGDMFSIREVLKVATHPIEWSNEIAYGFFSPGIKYNWAFCISGTCHGAMLWTEDDIANPDELIGPVPNTFHDQPGADVVGLGFVCYQGDSNQNSGQYLRQMKYLGNSNFSNKFWVVSGNAMQYPYFPSATADLDGDRDVDGNDFLTFSLCYNGALRAPQSGCANLDADQDGDGDVDGFDFTTWSLCHNGSLKRPQPSCMPPDLTSCP